MKELETAIIKNILDLCHNKKIIDYVIRLFKDFKENIIEIDEKHIYAKYYEEVLEININNNYFTIYTTNWGTTNRRKILFFRMLENEMLYMEDNDINCNGVILKNYTYHFYNNELVSAKYSKRVNLEYENQKIVRKINKEELVDIYLIKDDIAIKKVNNNGNIECFLTTIKPINSNNIKLFYFLNTVLDNKIDYNDYQEKIKKLK